MKKTILALMITSMISNIAFAQKKEKEVKYDKMYYKNLTKETNDINIIL